MSQHDDDTHRGNWTSGRVYRHTAEEDMAGYWGVDLSDQGDQQDAFRRVNGICTGPIAAFL